MKCIVASTLVGCSDIALQVGIYIVFLFPSLLTLDTSLYCKYFPDIQAINADILKIHFTQVLSNSMSI